MKFICNRQKLCEAVLNVSRAVTTKSSIPALEGILFQAADQTLTLTGYDLEMGITTVLEADIQEPGDVVINARLISDILRKVDCESVTITVDAKMLTIINAGVSEFTILGNPASEYPDMPQIGSESQLALKADTLKSMIDQTIFAVAITDQKPVHTGSLFSLKDGEITIVSVDGFRLAIRKEKAAVSEELSFVVPGKTLSEISKLLGDLEEDVQVFVGKKHIIFEIKDYRIISRLLEGEFLDYKAAIPTSAATTVRLSAGKFVDCVERVSLLITDRLKSPLKVAFEEGTVSLSCTTSMGKAFDQLPCQITGEQTQIGFNNKYLIDALKNCDCDEIRLELNGPLSPMQVLPVEGDSFLFLVLPVRLKNEN